MKHEMERKEQEKKSSQKIEYVSGGTQLGTVIPTPKVNMPIPGISSAVGGLLSIPAPIDSVVRDGRPIKKSKWDKVDGDRRNPLATGGQDSAVSAAVLSAPNAGSKDGGKLRRKDQVRRSLREDPDIPIL